MAKEPSEKTLIDIPATPSVPLVGGVSVPASQGKRFIVRNAGRYVGSYVLDGKSFDLEPGAFEIVNSKPSALTAHLAVQAL